MKPSFPSESSILINWLKHLFYCFFFLFVNIQLFNYFYIVVMVMQLEPETGMSQVLLPFLIATLAIQNFGDPM